MFRAHRPVCAGCTCGHYVFKVRPSSVFHSTRLFLDFISLRLGSTQALLPSIMAAAATMPQLPPDQLKFMEEAAKRKREDGTQQFQDLHFSDNDRLRSLVDDIYADHAALDKRTLPIESGGTTKFLILGAGMGGIMNAIKLVQAGFKQEDIVLAEAGGGVGGTWYFNRYPGLHCDVESYVYMPMLEETGYIPSHKYASSAEIRNYLIQLVEKFALGARIMFRTKINSLQWDEETKTWKAEMTTGHGPAGKEKRKLWANADTAILSGGMFGYPHVPKIPGLAGFEGGMFHTSRWNYDITGGSGEDPFSELKNLKGKRVGYIGTGATAIQAVPELAKYAKELYIFQRTPSQVNPRDQRPTDPTEWREKVATGPGWQKERMENLAQHLSRNLPEGAVNLVNDEWSKLKAYCAIVGSERFAGLTPDKVPEYIGQLQEWDVDHNAKVRQRVASIVSDKSTAEKLTPWYPTWCKRPTFSDVYLQTFNNPNVHLVDTDGKGIDSVKPRSVVVNGEEYSIDVLILSTGYRSPTHENADPARHNEMEIVGRNGISMTDKMARQGASFLHGVFTNGFPNLFINGIAQSSVTASINHVLEVQGSHIVSIISRFIPPSTPKEKKVTVEPSIEAEEAWALTCMSGAVLFSSVAVCTPGYMTMEGDSLKPKSQEEMMKQARSSLFISGLVPLDRKLESWRADGYKGVVVSST